MAKVLDAVKKELETGENIQHQYRAIHNGREGILITSDRKLRLMERKGFFNPNYRVVWEVPYDKINEVAAVASHRFELETEGQKQGFTTLGTITANTIVDEIRDLRKIITKR
jgi:hypothetical protein